MKLNEIHLIHAAPEPGRGGSTMLWFSAHNGYDLDLLKDGSGVVVKSKKSGIIRVIPMTNLSAYEPAQDK